MAEARAKTPENKKAGTSTWNMSKGKKSRAKEKTEKIPTHEVTFTLWQQGKTLADIAAERTLTVTTIEGHFAKLVETGKVNLNQIMAADKIDFIHEKMKSYTGPDSLTELKSYLGNDVSFGEIRLWKAGRKDVVNNE
jgi:uncharacterized protein YpbB